MMDLVFYKFWIVLVRILGKFIFWVFSLSVICVIVEYSVINGGKYINNEYNDVYFVMLVDYILVEVFIF